MKKQISYQSPPRWANKFLEWFCDPGLIEEIQGDLFELYAEHCASGKNKKAKLFFIWHVFRSFRIGVIDKKAYHYNALTMTKNNFKIAFRVLARDKFNTSINLLSLTIGLTCFFLLGSYVKQELSFDQFHSKKDQIFRVWLKEDYGGDKVFFNSRTPLLFESLLKENIEEIENAVQMDIMSFPVGDISNQANEAIAFVSPAFFDVFDFKILAGNKEAPLDDKNKVILSSSHSLKYFGNEDPIGKSLIIEVNGTSRNFIVDAVMQDISHNSSISFNMAISNENYRDIYGERAFTAWFNVSQETYVLTKPNATIESIRSSVDKLVMARLKDQVKPGEYSIGFQPLTSIHLDASIPPAIAPVGNEDYVYILAAIALLVLVIACINYTTLSIGQSLRRRKEVGVRKVMGALKSSLINQYLSESIVLAGIASLLGLALAFILLPTFNELIGTDVALLVKPWYILPFIGLVLVIGIVSGMYPAIVLAGFKTIAILAGRKVTNSNHYIRKAMVVFQFVATIFLISSTIVMSQQLNYLRSKDLGFNYNTVVSVQLTSGSSASSLGAAIATSFENGALLKEKLSQYPDINAIGMGSHVFGTTGWGQLGFTDDNNSFRQIRVLVADPAYFETFAIDVEKGRKFKAASDLDQRQSVIVNEKAANYFGLSEPIGKKLPNQKFGDHTIIGVTNDFNFASLHNDVEPLVIVQNIDILMPGVSDVGFNDSPIPKLIFRYNGSQLSQMKTQLEQAWEATFPAEELSFSFIEENMRNLYANEERMSRLVTLSTMLSIIIASLGLLGLTVLVVNTKVKEIGIRKVVGASNWTIFKMLSKGFSIQLLLGAIISIPITYVFMSDWLSDFSFRINIGADVFIWSTIVALFIAFIAISFNTFKAAFANPVDALKGD